MEKPQLKKAEAFLKFDYHDLNQYDLITPYKSYNLGLDHNFDKAFTY